MALTVCVRDETTRGDASNELTLELLSERITVRELIRSRVYQEVKDHNLKANQQVFCGLVQPTDAEQQLNGYRLKKPRQLDWKKQYDIAIESFERNAFLILVDDKQVEGLDTEMRLDPTTRISFLKLIPLVGG